MQEKTLFRVLMGTIAVLSFLILWQQHKISQMVTLEDLSQAVAEEGYNTWGKLQDDIQQSYNEGYRAGRYHILGDLVECRHIGDSDILRSYLLLGEYMNENGEALNMRINCEE